MITDSEAEKALDYIRDNATKVAQAKANRVYVEEFRKTIKAQLMREHSELPLGAQEREAYADERYKQHLAALKEAIEKDEYLRWMMTAAEAKISAWQTQSRNNRVNV
jgi:phage host-nuclease inhibitor protein Gam